MELSRYLEKKKKTLKVWIAEEGCGGSTKETMNHILDLGLSVSLPTLKQINDLLTPKVVEPSIPVVTVAPTIEPEPVYPIAAAAVVSPLASKKKQQTVKPVVEQPEEVVKEDDVQHETSDL